MDDVDRSALTQAVFKKLAADKEFRQRLTARNDEGAHPIVVALRDDAMADVLNQVMIHGGAANVIVPYLNGLVGVSMINGALVSDDDPEVDALDPACTVGVFLERLRMDGPSTYTFPGGVRDSGRAELVAVAG